MGQAKSGEIHLATQTTEGLLAALENFREHWKSNPALVPRGFSCAESKHGEFVLVAAESVFTTLPGACVIKGIGAVELLGPDPVFEAGAHSKTLVLKRTAEGWRFSIKFVRPIVRERNAE